MESKMGVLAAVEVLKRGFAGKIILSGGHTAGTEYASEADAMREYLERKFPGATDDRICLEQKSLDTAGNAEAVRALVGAATRIALLTGKAHLPRAIRLFHAYGVRVVGVSAETELERRSHHYHRLVGKFRLSCRTLAGVVKEALLLTVLLVDAKGKLSQLIATRLRSSASRKCSRPKLRT